MRNNNDEKYIEANAKKMAQEQLRNVVSTIFLTGEKYSIDIPAMSAIYESPLNPGMKLLGDKIKQEMLNKWPQLSYVFRDDKRNLSYEPILLTKREGIVYSPEASFVDISENYMDMVIPDIEDMMPVDKILYIKKYQINNMIDLHSSIKISVATFGQDQRHRTIKRTVPVFTGEFYSPEVITRLHIENEINVLMGKWKELNGKIGILFEGIAPYGAVVHYEKKANINALAHEQQKRLCWCAQEEIYNVNRILRDDLEDVFPNSNYSLLLDIFLPPCMKEGGKCYEGGRFCRRAERDKTNPCPERKI